MRRLWRLYAATNNYHSWYAINTHAAHADLHAFMRECNTLSLHMYENDTPHLCFGFTGGWADFFADSLRIRCCVGSSPLTVTPGAAFGCTSPVDFVFGSTLLSNSELAQSIFRRDEHVLLRPEALSPKRKADWFGLIENELLAPGPVHSCVFVLYRRDTCRLTNAWLESFSTKGMVTTLASLNRFPFLHMTTKGKRPLLSAGAWELCVIHRAESTSSLFYDTHAVREALLRLTRRHRSNTTPSPFIFLKCLTVTERNRRMDAFWAEWDVLADERKALLCKRRVPWTRVDANLCQINLLLANSPCPRLSRISRLAQIPLGSSLRKAGIIIYAVVGHFPPYVGQLGAKTRNRRSPIRRLAEHARRANYLRRHFQGQRRRNLRTLGKFGHKPSLPRTLARVGTHKASIVPLHFTNRQEADRHEAAAEQLLSPTLNGVAPYTGPKNIEWLADDIPMPDNKPLAQIASEFLTAGRNRYSAPQLFHLITECRPILPSRLFDKVFSKVQKIPRDEYRIHIPRRIPLQLACYDKSFLSTVRREVMKRIHASALPSPMQSWLRHAVTVVPKQTPKVASLIMGRTTTAVKSVVTNFLVSRPGRPCEHSSCHILLFDELTSSIQSALHSDCPTIACSCPAVRKQAPHLFGPSQSHLLIRDVSQWSAILHPSLMPVVTQNARNATLPSDEFIDNSVTKLISTLKPFSDGCSPLFSADVLRTEIQKYRQSFQASTSALDSDLFDVINDRLRDLCLAAATWDKQPCRLHAVCAIHADYALLSLTVLCPSFTLIGVQVEPQQAGKFVLSKILFSALEYGILGFANRQGFWKKAMLDPVELRGFLHLNQQKFRAPSAFRLLKWKTNEGIDDWKWRLAVSDT